MAKTGPWADEILARLQERDSRESNGYEFVFQNYATNQDRLIKLSSAYTQVIRENQLLEKENKTLSIRSEAHVFTNSADVADLEQKLLRLQAEVIDLHREKEKLTKALQANEQHRQQQAIKIKTMSKLIEEEKDQNRLCINEIKRLLSVNEMLLNEQTANSLIVKSLEKDKRGLEEDKSKFLLQISALQQRVEELQNVESDMKLRMHREAVQKGLLEASSAQLSFSENKSSHRLVFSFVPDKVLTKVMAADHVNCVRFSPSGNRFSSGGLDCKVYLWTINNDKCESQTLVGCNAGISAVDFDPEETMVLGASSDFAVRVWTINDRRLKINLTGHSDRVVAARFMRDGSQVVTASGDRTIKLWDLNKRQCCRTILSTSACHDVVGCSALSTVVSGHFDQKLRMWDPRDGKMTNELVLSGRISGLDISLDNNYVLACTRNNSLHTIELRRNEVVRSFQADGFHINYDQVRPCFSPDGAFVACGSKDGGVFIWNTITGELETVLKEHQNMVVCTNWSPLGHSIISCESGKKIVVWSQL